MEGDMDKGVGSGGGRNQVGEGISHGVQHRDGETCASTRAWLGSCSQGNMGCHLNSLVQIFRR